MKLETVRDRREATTKSILAAEKYKSLVTPPQYEILKKYVYTIEFDKDEGWSEKYRGCGSEWVEIDPHGNFIDMQYFCDKNTRKFYEILYLGDFDEYCLFERTDDPSFYEDDYHFEIVDAISPPQSEEEFERYMSCGSKSQNVESMLFGGEWAFKPKVLPNGNMRIFVNFSSTQLIRF